MKVGIIVPNNLWFCPYVQIYRSILDSEKVPYDIITWCRDCKDEAGCIQYKTEIKTSNPFIKLYSYYSFASFIRRTIKENKYDRLIVFTPQVGIFISSFLKKKYKGKYIFDYRDLSIEQSFCFKRPFTRLLKNSAANVISSPGFEQYLPKGYNYILSHNFDIAIVKKALDNNSMVVTPLRKTIDVLTIGGIRDYESNVQVIDALANKEGFSVRFVGRGPSADSLKKRAVDIGASNVTFEGFYPKEKEKEYVEECTFLNIFYPRKPSHNTALSNRFYNSLIYRKPMITTADTTQGNYASKYKVGIAITDCSNLDNDLKEYIKNVDQKEYTKQCDVLLNEFIADYEKFYNMFCEFIKKL